MATIEGMNDEKKKYHCYTCKNKHKEADDWEKTNRLLRERKGCFDEIMEYKVDNVIFRKCVGNFILPNTEVYLSMWILYQKGVMPYPGSYTEQPAKIIQIFNIINARKQELSKDKNGNESKSDAVKQCHNRVNVKLTTKRAMDGQRDRSQADTRGKAGSSGSDKAS